MANITLGEARIGWEVFHAARGSLSQQELQSEVDQLSIGKISDRMFQHYRSLYDHGYDHYITINRFDILKGAQPFSNESANSRYRYSSLGRTVRVTVMRESPYTFLAFATSISDAGITLRVKDEIIGERLRVGKARIRSTDYLHIDSFKSDEQSVDGRLADKIERNPIDGTHRIDIEFTRLRSVAEFTGGSSMSVLDSPLALIAGDEEAIAADTLGRRIYYMLEAVENVRALLNDVAARETYAYHDRAYPAQVRTIAMQSPLVIVLVTPGIIISTIGAAWLLIKQAPVAYRTIQEGRLAGAQTARERAVVEGISLDNDIKRDNRDTSAIMHELVRESLRSNGADLRPPDNESRLFENTLDQLRDNLTGLLDEGVVSLGLPAWSELPEVDGRKRPPSDEVDEHE